MANKNYSLLVRAENGAGQGEPASAVFKILDVTMPEESDGSTLVPPNDDQHLGKATYEYFISFQKRRIRWSVLLT